MFNLQFFADGDVTKVEEVKQEEIKEEMFTKKELEERIKNAIKEGERKEQKRLFEDLGVTSIEDLKKLKADGDLTKTQYDELKNQYDKANGELSKYQAERVALKFVKSIDDAEDLVALVKGKGLELTEVNLKAVAEKRFQSTNVQQVGTNKKEETKTPKSLPKVF
jgi:predicted XRE-type DNA-binding protein